jgi:hypothetical protein
MLQPYLAAPAFDVPALVAVTSQAPPVSPRPKPRRVAAYLVVSVR